MDHALRAWRSLSDAVRAFPYSDPVARSPGPFQKGPTHPLWLVPNAAGRGRWRSWQNDLDWTDPFGPDIVRASFAAMERHQRRGLAALRRAIPLTSGQDRTRLSRDIHLALVWWSAVETMIAVIDTTRARDDLPAFPSDRRTSSATNATRSSRARTRLAAGLRPGWRGRDPGLTPQLLARTLGELDDVLT